jgi:DNA recombination protein RmuC
MTEALQNPAVQFALAVVLLLGAIFVLAVMIWSRLNRRDGQDTALALKFEALQAAMERTDRTLTEETRAIRDDSERRAGAIRDEVARGLLLFSESIERRIEAQGKTVAEATAQGAALQADTARTLKLDLAQSLTLTGDAVKASTESFGRLQREQLGGVIQTVDTLMKRLDVQSAALQKSVTDNFGALRQDTGKALDEMRRTVDERLQKTLEARLSESFKVVSERLERVHQGLGEMQTLAAGVGDLKRALTNVKTRGGWAEVQLGAMLADMFPPGIVLTNVKTNPASNDLVEFALKLPGQGEAAHVLLPIDAKFPQEDYERLVAAQEAADPVAVEAAASQLERVIRREAEKIGSKYLAPPSTTDFGIMYLPTEGLFAEIVRRPGLLAEIQAKSRVTITGPTTLAALLTSLQMGFRTLAIEKRSSEVWQVLSEAKAEFSKYADTWDRVKKQLGTVLNTVDDAGTRTRAVERRLRDVSDLDAAPTLPHPE